MPSVSFHDKIGEGTYREVYQVTPEVCVKRMKSYHKKDNLLGRIGYPTSLYTLAKFSIWDFNDFELKEYRKLLPNIPGELSGSFAKIIGVGRKDDESLLFQETVRDHDNGPSRPLMQTGPIFQECFWDRLMELRDFFTGNNIHFFNVGPDNVIVKKTEQGILVPVFTDYKRIGQRTYPYQLHLKLDCLARQKVMRRFERLAETYRA